MGLSILCQGYLIAFSDQVDDDTQIALKINGLDLSTVANCKDRKNEVQAMAFWDVFAGMDKAKLNKAAVKCTPLARQNIPELR